MNEIKELLVAGLNFSKESKFSESADVLNQVLNMNIDIEIRKTVLFQIAICYMQLEEYNEAEDYLLKYLEINIELEVYDLLCDIYTHTKEREKLLGVYEKIYKLDKKNDFAFMKLIILKNALEKDLSEMECLKAVDIMDCLIKKGNSDEYFGEIKASAYNCLFDVACKLVDADRAVIYFDLYASSISEEERKNGKRYKSFLIAAFAQGFYSEKHGVQRHIKMVRECYQLLNLERVNSFNYGISSFRVINIGFLSSDFKVHPVGRFLFSLFKEKIVNSGINYFCYDTFAKDEVRENDVLNAKIRDLADKYTDISKMDDDEAEKLILADRLDILLELNGLSYGSKRELVMRRLAPVQLTWIGWPCTSAVHNVDYTIVDPITDPAPYSQNFYTEKLVYLSKSFLCYPLMFDYDNDPKLKIDESPFVKNGYITFGSFANALKYSDKTLKAWESILSIEQNSRIIISLSTKGNEISRNAVKRRFFKNGIDMSRIEFVEPAPLAKYLPRYNDVDIILDTFPFNGATTTCDALSMGVPVVSLYGERHHERVGLSMLKNVGLEDLTAPTYEEYIEKAVKLARDRERLKNLRRSLRQTFINSPLGDCASFKNEFENVMRKLYIGNCAKNSKKQTTRSKSIKELIVEIARGFYFINNLIYNKEDLHVVDYVKNELCILQKELLQTLMKSSESEEEIELYEKYDKCVSLLYRDVKYEDIKLITKMCEEIFKKIL